MTRSNIHTANRGEFRDTGDRGKVQSHWRELDVLRGMAAVMMVVNHVGIKFLSPQYAEGGFTGIVLFIGSFAPVMFFFVTGVGAGIQSVQKKKSSRWLMILNKVGILAMADLLMAWGGGDGWRLDFLGFIGLSILILEFVRNSKSPVLGSSTHSWVTWRVLQSIALELRLKNSD